MNYEDKIIDLFGRSDMESLDTDLDRVSKRDDGVMFYGKLLSENSGNGHLFRNWKTEEPLKKVA
tara:strand:+ start:330 stop:521 length:192 start_codon:yes stop_codon:yes gene_type:complete